MNKVLELSSKSSKGGRRKIKMVLLTIHNEGEKNLNGISWKEEYVLNNLESAKGIPICASFLNEEKDEPLGHGYTDTVEIGDGKSEPLFNDSECCGVIEDAKIEDLEINGEIKRVLVGYGVLFYQRYKNFCDYVKEQIKISEVKSSIEIVGKDGGSIVYDGGYNEDIRYPQIFDFSATAILGIKEADENCYVLEVAQANQNKEEQNNMDEKMLQGFVSEIKQVISETNSKNEELSKTITELNEVIANKDTTIAELNASSEELKTALEKAQEDYQEIWKKEDELYNEIKELKKQLAEAQAKERVGEMNSAIADFSDEEKEYAKAEIEAFTADPINCEINSVVNKIWEGIGKKSKEDAKVIAEQNASNNVEVDDIFAEVCEINSAEEDESIF